MEEKKKEIHPIVKTLLDGPETGKIVPDDVFAVWERAVETTGFKDIIDALQKKIIFAGALTHDDQASFRAILRLFSLGVMYGREMIKTPELEVEDFLKEKGIRVNPDIQDRF